MTDFNVRSDAVNVEQLMEQIRGRIREKRGVDYTEDQIREMATVKLEKFLDPRGVRSDLLDQFRRARPPYSPPELPNFAFEEQTLFESHRAPLRWIRKLLNPILKLFFNPNPLIQALNIQSRLNTMAAERAARSEAARHDADALSYEVLHNLVIETTRMGIEVKNLKMKVESLTSRLEFNERRARALESVVVYKAEERPPAPASDGGRPAREPRESRDRGDRREQPREFRGPREVPHAPAPVPPSPAPVAQPMPADAVATTPEAVPGPPGGAPQDGPGQRSRRRRRRRGRRGGGSAAALMGGQPAPGTSDEAGHADAQPHEQGSADDGVENDFDSPDGTPNDDSGSNDQGQ
jgi:hypothetical protein